MLLRPSSHRILKIFSKKITTQTHCHRPQIPFNMMKTTEHVDFIIPIEHRPQIPFNKMKTTEEYEDFIFPKEPPESPYYNSTTAKDFIIPKHFVHYLFPKLPSRVSQKLDFNIITDFLQDSCPPSITFDRMISKIHGLFGGHHPKSIVTVIPKLKSVGVFVDDSDKDSEFLLLLRLLTHAGKHDVLVDAYHHMVKSHGFVPNTFASHLLLDSLFRTCEYHVALNVFKQMNSTNYFTFDIAFFHLSHLNDIANSSHVLTEMLRMPCYPSTNDGFNNLLISFCKMNALLQVCQLLGLMAKLGFGIYFDAYSLLIRKYDKLFLVDHEKMLQDIN